MKVAVIIGSTREARLADKPAEWIYDLARRKSGWDVELVDIRDFSLPFFNEVASNRWAPTKDPNAVRWQKKIAEFDAYLFVTAEYNRSVPGSLKNALDQAYVEWNHKPMGILAYGSTGGARAAEHLRTIGIELQMVPVRSAVHISGTDFFRIVRSRGDEPMSAIEDNLKPSVEALFEDLEWWGKATMNARTAG